VKVREVLKMLKDAGWFLVTTERSHHQFKHPTWSGRVTVSGHPRDVIHPTAAFIRMRPYSRSA
jgi:predicted RNA binding protein YcfA (HicA-like mRNA interferase family)